MTIWQPAEAADSPFLLLNLGMEGETHGEPDELFRETVLPLANETGATRIVCAGKRSVQSIGYSCDNEGYQRLGI